MDKKIKYATKPSPKRFDFKALKNRIRKAETKKQVESCYKLAKMNQRNLLPAQAVLLNEIIIKKINQLKDAETNERN